MPKRVVVIVAIAAFIAAGLILLLAKPPQTSQPGALVAPISPLASSSVQTSATQFGITENVSSTFDTRSWITYNDADYHFAFRYPSRFVLRTTGPVAYAIKRLSLSDQRSGRLLNFYVTTTSSIAAWNDYVNSEDTHNCERECDEPFSYLNCETSSTACTESSFQGSFSVNFERRAVFTKRDLRLEMLVKVPLATSVVPTSTDLYELSKLGALSPGDVDFLNIFNLISKTLQFAPQAKLHQHPTPLATRNG